MSQKGSLPTLSSLISRVSNRRASVVAQLPHYLIPIWSFVGAFCGIAVLQAVFGQRYFKEKGVPPIIPSFGSSAALIYGAIENPVSQPRSLVGGHFIGALVGVGIARLFLLLPTEAQFDELQWVCGALAVATTVVVLQLLQTVHPPAGATSLVAVVSSEVRNLGWYYLPVVLLSSVLVLSVALLVNNVQQRYPEFWIIPPSKEEKGQQTDNQTADSDSASVHTAPVEQHELLTVHGVHQPSSPGFASGTSDGEGKPISANTEPEPPP
uniref:HPP transmembrane region domain-containing protein n=1 Tax=Moniliophthora roreri TaxID=221103 RepID=A0A0W0EUV7_MONRR